LWPRAPSGAALRLYVRLAGGVPCFSGIPVLRPRAVAAAIELRLTAEFENCGTKKAIP